MFLLRKKINKQVLFCFFFFITQFGFGQVNRTGDRLQLKESLIQLKELGVGNQVSSVNPVPGKGELFVFVFWMASCGPCIKELDRLNMLSETWDFGNRVKIFAVSTDSPGDYKKVNKLISEHKWSFLCYHDSRAAFKSMFLGNWHGTPQSFIVDSEGIIKYHKFGYQQGDFEKFKNQLIVLLMEQHIYKQN